MFRTAIFNGEDKCCGFFFTPLDLLVIQLVYVVKRVWMGKTANATRLHLKNDVSTENRQFVMDHLSCPIRSLDVLRRVLFKEVI